MEEEWDQVEEEVVTIEAYEYDEETTGCSPVLLALLILSSEILILSLFSLYS